MNRILFLFGIFSLTVLFSACGISLSTTKALEASKEQPSYTVSGRSSGSVLPSAPSAMSEEKSGSEGAEGSEESEKENEMVRIQIIVQNKTFSAVLYDHESAQAFKQLLPMTLEMQELNGNEKYHYLTEALPSDPKRPDGILAGDLMLYGKDCIVLFYESFSTSYRYTPLGRIDDPEGLARALGDGSVSVTFQ